MRGLVTLTVVCATVLAATAVGAQKATLTEAEITAALALGAEEKRKEHGLDMQDSFASFSAAMAGTGTVGFSLVAYTPTTWVTQLSARASKEFRSLQIVDLPADALAPVLRVLVFPDRPIRMDASASVAWARSVEHVVIRDEQRKVAIQPIHKASTAEELQNVFGAKTELAGVVVSFSLDDLKTIRGPLGDQEFFITVIGERGRDKDFKVKQKHFARLR